MPGRKIVGAGIAAVFGVALLGGVVFAQQKSLKDQLVGTWMLAAVTAEGADGSKAEPFGVDPKGIIIFTADGYFYGGKVHDSLSRVEQALRGLPSVERVVLVHYAGDSGAIAGGPPTIDWDEFLGADSVEPRFEQLPFNHPLYILYSSGTTGVPKCIVHGAGGTLLEHLKELQIHTDVKPGDRVFYFAGLERLNLASSEVLGITDYWRQFVTDTVVAFGARSG